jgi:tetratricopeptide (TPR) repeat protein
VRVHLGRFDAAREDFRLSLALYPDEPVTHYNLASLLARQRRFGEALAALETAIGIDPGYQKAIFLRDRIRDRQ